MVGAVGVKVGELATNDALSRPTSSRGRPLKAEGHCSTTFPFEAGVGGGPFGRVRTGEDLRMLSKMYMNSDVEHPSEILASGN